MLMCMRKFQNFAFAGAIALAGVAGFSACSSDDTAEAPINPTFDGESVKTAFAINVAAPSKGGTRMTDVNTQNKNKNFLGMQNIHLLPLTLSNASDVPATTDAVTKVISLTNLTSSEVSSSQSSKIYNDVNIPVGTNNFLFYGTGPQTDEFDNGQLEMTIPTGTVAGISFNLKQIPTTGVSSVQNKFESYLNNILKVQATDASSNTVYWGNITNSSTDANATILKNAYDAFITLTAGSAEAVKNTVQGLWDVVSNIAVNNPSDGNVYKQLAYNIEEAIKGSTENIRFNETSGTLSFASPDTKIIRFPVTQDFPKGSMILAYTAGENYGTFAYVTSNISLGEGSNKIDFNTITYPACIAYYDNTPLRASDAASFTWPNTTTNWDDFSSWTGFGDEVKATSTKVALQNNINYGVACLETTVQCTSSELPVRPTSSPSGTQSSASISINGEGFPVTGLLIGGQPEKVCYDFVANQDKNTFTVYDKKVVTGMAAKNGTASSTNYTLVLDNFTTDSQQEDVTVAIELTNNTGQSFEGVDGIVEKDATFYLIGKLELSNPNSGSEIKWPEYGSGTGSFVIPTSYENRYPAKKGTNRVFVQDYTTKANFKISSLKNAYVTIPDLRASKLELGLSVDLTWQSGLEFDITLN